MITQHTPCVNYESQVTQAVQTYDLDTLKKLLVTLNRQSDCPSSYLEGVKRSMAQIVAAEADNLRQQGQVGAASKRLKLAPTKTWNTQIVHGHIAAQGKQWQKAALYYNQAWDLINDPQATPQEPTLEQTKELFQWASGAQILAGDLDATVNASGEATGIMRDSNERSSIKIRKRPVPIQFEFGKISLDEKGKKSVEQLKNYLNARRANQVTLIGHTDSKGSHEINDKISKQRASEVKKYLQTDDGVTIEIDVIGKGKREPLPIPRFWKLKDEEINALNRRVEFSYQR